MSSSNHFNTNPPRRVQSVPPSANVRMDYQSFSDTIATASSPMTSNRRVATRNDPLARTNPQPDTSTSVMEDGTIPPSAAVNNNNTTSTVDSSMDHYRGFGTSINDMFMDVQNERIDCCSITLCGILQNDRDRYLMSQIAPPSFFKRFLVHVMIPFCIFCAAGLGAMQIPDIVMNEIMSVTLVGLFFAYLLLQCAKGRYKRIEVRKDILFTKYQIQQQNLLSSHMDDHHHPTATTTDHLPPPQQQQRQGVTNRRSTMVVLLEQQRPRRDDTNQPVYYLGQTVHDMSCAHPCCMIGYYPVDYQNGNAPLNLKRNDHRHQMDENLCRCMYDYVCPSFCGSYVQCCGMCAIAQEARDIETYILPPPYRRIDYITMEAVMKYYPDIYHYRHFGTTINDSLEPVNNAATHMEIDSIGHSPTTNSGSISSKSPRYGIFGHPLSRLSYRLLQFLFIFFFIMLLWSLFGKYYFTYVVGRHRYGQHQYGIQDFGLLIATFVQSFALLRLWAYCTNRIKPSELSLDAIIKYFASGFFLSASLALFWEMLSIGIIKTLISLLLAIFGIDRVAGPETDHSWVTTFGSNSLVNYPSSMTTLVSNLYGSSEIDRTDYATVFGLDHPFLYSLYILIVTFLVAGFIEELCKYFGYRMVEHPDFFTCEELDEASIILQSSQENTMDDDDDIDENSDMSRLGRVDARSRPALMNYAKHRQSVQARGAAITLAMVSAAIGFSCCENLIYVFHYAGESVILELGVLLQRSCFPIHPVFAAIQSIGVCQRELEGVRSIRLGQIILPAVILHGTFDFFIIFIGFVGRLVGQDEEEGDLRITNTTEFLAIISCLVIMTASFLYLYNESGKQRERLAAIDFESTVDRSSLI